MVQVQCDGMRGVNAPHRRANDQDDLDGMPHVFVDNGFLGERDSEKQTSPVLVIRERRDKMTWAMLSSKGTEFPWIVKTAAKFIDQLGHNRVTVRCDNEQAIEELAREIAQARQEESQTVLERPAGSVAGQNAESCAGKPHGNQSPARRKDTVLARQEFAACLNVFYTSLRIRCNRIFFLLFIADLYCLPFIPWIIAFMAVSEKKKIRCVAGEQV